MRYLVTSAEMKQYDKATIERIGIPGPVLMERAALQTFAVLKERGCVIPYKKALILAGVGNNGGDGLVLARLLCEANLEVYVWVVGDEAKATDDFKLQKKILGSFPVQFVSVPSEKAYDIVVDALFGVGLSRPLEGKYKEAIERLNQMTGTKLAMDVPSGVSSDTGEILGASFDADLTVTYGFEKKGLYLYPGTTKTGEVILADVGIGWRAIGENLPGTFAMEGSIEELLLKRDPNGNKGTFGKALILAGSYNMAGAALLCTKACYRTGAGMVKLLTAPENRVIVQDSLPEALLGNIEEEKDLQESLAWCDVVCIGPGLGKTDATKHALESVLDAKKPLIIDADGINMLSEDQKLLEVLKMQGQAGRQILLTPHAGEFLRLWNGFYKDVLSMQEFKKSPWDYAKRLAEELSVIIIAKDARTFICAPTHPVCMNLSGNSGMATAGSGDVLAGILTAFVAAKTSEDVFSKACKAVRVHGLLGDAAAKRMGEHAVMASELIP